MIWDELNNSTETDQLLQRIADLPLEGVERSIKLTRAGAFSDRFLAGVPCESVPDEFWRGLVDQLGMPHEFIGALEERRAEANLILVGFERSVTGYTYKVYLEFWESLRARVLSDPGFREPTLLHLGFKWDPQRLERRAITRYTCLPMLSILDISRRLDRMGRQWRQEEICGAARDIVNLGATRIRHDSFIYLEVEEVGNPRTSFDINVYKAHLTIKSIHNHLDRITRYLKLDREWAQSCWPMIEEKGLGHISGGIDREGQPFFTIYYPLDNLLE